jgi:hypothetical protein
LVADYLVIPADNKFVLEAWELAQPVHKIHVVVEISSNGPVSAMEEDTRLFFLGFEEDLFGVEAFVGVGVRDKNKAYFVGSRGQLGPGSEKLAVFGSSENGGTQDRRLLCVVCVVGFGFVVAV